MKIGLQGSTFKLKEKFCILHFTKTQSQKSKKRPISLYKFGSISDANLKALNFG